ncbi:hypothetical protein VTL71DRAFT_9457 [Oculimacula yallundae]|uniref:Uncharacterized protein n=1 Tax=Oculimacula yallundae TaxID=86028 RepID=A0ABR4BRY0_9HELO
MSTSEVDSNTNAGEGKAD